MTKLSGTPKGVDTEKKDINTKKDDTQKDVEPPPPTTKVSTPPTGMVSPFTNQPTKGGVYKPDIPVYWCSLCALKLASPVAAFQHMSGRIHMRKLKETTTNKGGQRHRTNLKKKIQPDVVESKDHSEPASKKSKQDDDQQEVSTLSEVKCTECDVVFECEENRDLHVKFFHQVKGYEIMLKDESIPMSTPMKCDVCDIIFQSDHNLQEHFAGKRHKTNVTAKEMKERNGFTRFDYNNQSFDYNNQTTGRGRGRGGGGRGRGRDSSSNFKSTYNNERSSTRPNNSFGSKSSQGSSGDYKPKEYGSQNYQNYWKPSSEGKYDAKTSYNNSNSNYQDKNKKPSSSWNIQGAGGNNATTGQHQSNYKNNYQAGSSNRSNYQTSNSIQNDKSKSFSSVSHTYQNTLSGYSNTSSGYPTQYPVSNHKSRNNNLIDVTQKSASNDYTKTPQQQQQKSTVSATTYQSALPTTYATGYSAYQSSQSLTYPSQSLTYPTTQSSQNLTYPTYFQRNDYQVPSTNQNQNNDYSKSYSSYNAPSYSTSSTLSGYSSQVLPLATSATTSNKYDSAVGKSSTSNVVQQNYSSVQQQSYSTVQQQQQQTMGGVHNTYQQPAAYGTTAYTSYSTHNTDYPSKYYSSLSTQQQQQPSNNQNVASGNAMTSSSAMSNYYQTTCSNVTNYSTSISDISSSNATSSSGGISNYQWVSY